ncbi:MAG: hypothetical protein ACT4OP_10665 [Actinomycetota bacterium]
MRRALALLNSVVPRTFPFAVGGERVKTHNGVIDERTLALMIDELATTAER